ncbi:MAG: CHAT domain-containing protein [Thermoanaerobaculia bacterium]
MPDRPSGRRRRSVLLSSALLLGLAGRMPALESDRELCSRFNDAGDFLQALAPCAAAVAAARNSPAERAGLAAALNGHGLALEMTGEREAAEASYREALDLQRELGARDQEAIVLSNLAALAIGAGDYGRALGWLADEEAVAHSAGDADWVEEELRIVRINRSVAFEQLGAYREALAEIRPLVASDAPEVGHSAALAANLAVLYRNVGDPRRALRLLDRAGREFESAGDRAALANVHLNRGLVYALNLEQPEEARRELDRALELARETGDRAEELRTLQTLGDLELARGGTAAAREAFTAALGLARASGAAAGEWAARTGLGRVLAAERKPEAALAELQSAVDVLERASGSVGNAELAGSLLRDQRRLFATAIDLLGERALAGDEEAALEALAWSERLRARELLSSLGSGRAATPIPVADLARFGDRFGTTLVYFFGAQKLWLWILDRNGVSMYAAGESAAIASDTLTLLSRLERGAAIDPALSNRLSQELLSAERATGGALRIVPDGVLFYLPFALLPDPVRPGERLVARTATHLLPSLSVRPLLAGTERPGRWRLAALGAPEIDLTADSARSRRSAAALLAARYGLPPLPGAAEESRRAAALVGDPSVVDIGTGASEGHLRRRAQEGAAVLHIAAHTLVDESLARGTALFLAPDGDDDGVVTPPELAALGLRTELVVLSGCRTALPANGTASASAMASLSGSLLAAGARSVLASLWEVDDASTAALMEQFYFRLAAGDRPAEALRAAQNRLADDSRWADPRHWAGFVLTGDPPPIFASTSGRTRRIGALLLIVAGCALWWWRSRRA